MTDARDQQPVRPPPTGAPPAFVIAVATMLVVGIALITITTYAATRTDGYRDQSWLFQIMVYGRGLIWSGATLATTSLMLVGFAELVRRSGPGVEGHAFRAAMVAMVSLLALTLAGLYMSYWWQPRAESSDDRRQTLETFWLWRQRLAFVAALVASGALVVGGRRNRTVLIVAAPLLVLTMLQYPFHSLRELVSYDHPRGSAQLWTQAGIDIGLRVGFCGALMAAVSAIGATQPPAPTDMVRAGQGLERVGSGLVARVIVALVTLFTLIMTVGAQSPSMARVASVLFPTGLLLASLAIVTGMIQVGSAVTVGAPRLRLYAGAALTMIAMTIEALKALALYMALRRNGSFDDSFTEDHVKHTAGALPYLTPALSVAGLLCILSAAARLRRTAPEARMDEAGINAAAASLVIFTALGVATFRWGQSGPHSVGVFIMASIFVGLANIVAQLSVARVCHRVGAALREQSALPTAVASLK